MECQVSSQATSLLTQLSRLAAEADDGSDSDSTDSSASWKKGTIEAERVHVMGASAHRDSDDSLLDSNDCKRLMRNSVAPKRKRERDPTSDN